MSVRFVVGENGVGKSQFLVEVAGASQVKAIVLCNTVHDRFKSSKKIRKFSAGNPSSHPNRVMKNAILFLIYQGSHRLRDISNVLTHCNYTSEIIVRIEINERAKNIVQTHARELLTQLDGLDFEKLLGQQSEHEFSIDFDRGSSGGDYSKIAYLEHVFRAERKLRSLGLIKPIEIYIQRKDGRRVSLMRASSGELSLITSLVFMLCNLQEAGVILIDEPENSLHPQWQKEYVPLLLKLIGYHEVDIFIATHSPMVVSGAQVNHEGNIGFYHPKTKEFTVSRSSGIEATLWEQFETISPESRYLSEKIVSKLNQLEAKEIGLADVLEFIDQMQNASFDQKQLRVFEAARDFASRIASGTDHD